ncbi:MAG: tetraacyldisaccharide 4'-kinase [Roseibium sp.]|nr:tetraacyldisaccharide 4'-kinase [Roseibium sp.]
MKAPRFWWSENLSGAAIVLWPVAWLYGWFAARRLHRRPRGGSNLPVICIGNYVAGGTGKTPFALMLAALLAKDGIRPGFLLRGYGGRAKGPVVVDPAAHMATDVGDEALLLAREAPTVVAADRVAGAGLAQTLDIDVLLMDDGFQNPSLKKDLAFALVDAATGVGNGLCLPAGPLRAPLADQIVKTDVLVIVGTGGQADEVVHLAARKGLPILHAELVPGLHEDLKDTPLHAFAGIGRPEKFFRMLEDLGLNVARTSSFPDHHAFTEEDAKRLLQQSETDGHVLVTTEKDMARIASAPEEVFRWLENRSATLLVAMNVSETGRLLSLVHGTVRNRAFRVGRGA